MTGLSVPAKRRWIRRFVSGEAGVVTVEFILWFPVFFFLFLSSVEAGFITAKAVMLERGLDMAIRDVRLGIGAMTHEAIKNKVCDNAIILPDCRNTIRLELKPVSTSSWTPLTGSNLCVDRAAPIDPAVDPTGYDVGIGNQLMLVRACALVQPLFPGVGLGLQLPKDSTYGDFILIATSAFVNEPGR